MISAQTMISAPAKMDFVILAAGESRRFSAQDLCAGPAKQFQLLSGKMVLLHSLESISQWPCCGQIIIVLPAAGVDGEILNILETAGKHAPVPVCFTAGGASRTESTFNGLKALGKVAHNRLVAVHDAARPFVPHQVLDRLLAACVKGADAAVPSLPLNDTIKHIDSTNAVLATIDRTTLKRVQTPQAFCFDTIFHLHQDNADNPAQQPVTDDSSLAEMAGLNVACIDGADLLEKITFAEDLDMMQTRQTEMRTASAFDVHRFSPDQTGPIMICGIAIDHKQGLIAHSDGDVGLHALCDAVLGTLSLGDIGQHFPASDPKWMSAPSDQFLQFALNKVRDAGGRVTLLDVTIICESPKISPHRARMRDRLSQISGLPAHRLSVKATTSERLGFTGRCEGIAALAQASVCLPTSYKGLDI